MPGNRPLSGTVKLHRHQRPPAADIHDRRAGSARLVELVNPDVQRDTKVQHGAAPAVT